MAVSGKSGIPDNLLRVETVLAELLVDDGLGGILALLLAHVLPLFRNPWVDIPAVVAGGCGVGGIRRGRGLWFEVLVGVGDGLRGGGINASELLLPRFEQGEQQHRGLRVRLVECAADVGVDLGCLGLHLVGGLTQHVARGGMGLPDVQRLGLEARKPARCAGTAHLGGERIHPRSCVGRRDLGYDLAGGGH